MVQNVEAPSHLLDTPDSLEPFRSSGISLDDVYEDLNGGLASSAFHTSSLQPNTVPWPNMPFKAGPMIPPLPDPSRELTTIGMTDSQPNHALASEVLEPTPMIVNEPITS